MNESATHYSFFVQAKSTIHIEKYMLDDGKYLSFPVDVDHLAHWNQFWEPVILTVWDAKADVTYWEIVQDFLESCQVLKSIEDGRTIKEITEDGQVLLYSKSEGRVIESFETIQDLEFKYDRYLNNKRR